MPFKGFVHLAQVVIFSGTKSLQYSILATLITPWSLEVWWLHSACCLLLFFPSTLINLARKLSILLIFFPRSKVWLYWPLLFFLYLIHFLAIQFLFLLILDSLDGQDGGREILYSNPNWPTSNCQHSPCFNLYSAVTIGISCHTWLALLFKIK